MSFSSQTKERLCAEKIKNRCCRRAMLYGLLLFAKHFSEEEIVLYSENKAVLRTADALALSCGFQSIRNFNRVFLSETGKTPQEFRRSAGE